jgi:hypothetical protein
MFLIRPILLSTLTLTAASQASAIECGDSVAGHVVLTHDLHCSEGWVALDVVAPGTVIDLNGYTLSGERALQGIAVIDVPGTSIRGPGRIKGFWVGVNGTFSDDVTVENIDFEQVGAGVLLNNSARTRVKANRFRHLDGHAVSLASLPSHGKGDSGQHSITLNTVQDAVFGFELCGARSRDSVVSDNSLFNIRDYAIALTDAASFNHIANNQMGDTGLVGIRLAGSSHNLVRGNAMKRGEIGIGLRPDFSGRCDTGSARAETRENRIEHNSVFEHDVSVQLGLGLDDSPAVLKNRIGGNKLHYSGLALYFARDTYANDARGNATDPGPPVHDEGVDNLW